MIKIKKILLIFVLSLIALFSSTVYAEALPEYIKIGLKFGSGAVSECFLKCEDGFLLYSKDNALLLETAFAEITLSINGDGNIDVFNTAQKAWLYTYKNEYLKICSAGARNLALNGAEYRGDFQISLSGGKMTVINHLLIEEYLRGVVPNEIPASWHTESLKAQAICARNYALTNFGKFKSYGFDLDDTVSSQVYRGANSEKASTDKAVAETKGKILKYNEEIAKTFFYSSSGGYTESAKNVWGGDFPYLTAVEDPYDEYQGWTVNYTPAEIEKKLSEKGVNIGNVADLDVKKLSESNRVIELLIKGDKGEHTLKLEAPRSFFNLKSNLYTIKKNYDGQRSASVISGGGVLSDIFNFKNIITKDGIFPSSVTQIITKDGIFPNSVTQIITKDGKISLENKSANILSFDFVGKGYGHGVGMSQYGAKGLAEHGYGYADILKHYFKGTYLD